MALAGAAVVALAMNSGAARAAGKVDIAIIVPLSGANASVGEQAVNAAKLAVEDINGAGGIKTLGGAKVNLIIADATNDPQGAINTTERVLTQHKVAGVYGLALSPLTTAALPAFVKHHVPVITSAISDTLVTPSNGGYLFQIAPKGSAFGNQQVEFLKFLNEKYKMGVTKAAILYVNN
ncbi:MAG: ABC transporter substrate-binding protein, partial [Burkholderiales bacterium]